MKVLSVVYSCRRNLVVEGEDRPLTGITVTENTLESYTGHAPRVCELSTNDSVTTAMKYLSQIKPEEFREYDTWHWCNWHFDFKINGKWERMVKIFNESY